MRKLVVVTNALLVFAWFGLAAPHGLAPVEPQTPQKTRPAAAKSTLTPEALDTLLAPIALYPDALLGQMLLCAANPGRSPRSANGWQPRDAEGHRAPGRRREIGVRAELRRAGPVPAGRDAMAGQIDWTTRVGQAFAADRSAVFASIQRLRAKAQNAGKLKSNAAAGRRDRDDRQRPAGDRDRAGQPAGRLRASIQPADRLHAPRRRWSSRKRTTTTQPWPPA